MTRIPTLDGWRGIAILLVLADHGLYALHFSATAGSGTGPDGVTLFFVLSGFLITSLLTAERQKLGAIDLPRFYKRRFVRLMPAAWAYLWFVAVFSMQSPSKVDSLIAIGAAIFFFRNYCYLSCAGGDLTGHFWTLSVEEQFYLVWPATLRFLGARWGRWVALFGAAGLGIYRTVWLNAHPFASNTQLQGTPLHANALLIGCSVALFLPNFRHLLRDWMALPLLVGVVACIARHEILVPFSESVLFALLLATTSVSRSKLFTFLDWRPLTFLGAISYSLYLWQQVFTMLAHRGGVFVWIGGFGLVAAAVGSYYILEKPLVERFRDKKPARLNSKPVEVVAE